MRLDLQRVGTAGFDASGGVSRRRRRQAASGASTGEAGAFGAGWYRARIYGRQGGYITQVVFGLDELAWPVTAETRERIRRHRER